MKRSIFVALLLLLTFLAHQCYSKDIDRLYEEMVIAWESDNTQTCTDRWSTIEQIADSDFYNCDYSSAILKYEKLHSFCKENSIGVLAAGMSIKIGECYLQQRDLKNTERYFEEAIIWAEKYGDEEMKYVALYHLAKLHLDTGDFSNAEKEFKGSLSFFETNPDNYLVEIRSVYCSLAILFFETEDLVQASAFYDRAISLYDKEDPEFVYFLHNASRLWFEAYELYKQLDDENIMQKALSNALQYNGYVCRIASERKNDNLLLPALIMRIQLCEITGLNNEADAYVRALEQYYNQSELYDSYIISKTLTTFYFRKGDCDKARIFIAENFQIAKKLLLDGFDYLSEYQREQYYNKYGYLFNDIYPLFCYTYYPENDSISCFAYDNELFIKGLLLNAGNIIKNGILESGDTAIIAKWDELTGIKNQMFKLQSQSLDKRTGLLELGKRAEKLEKELIRESNDYREAAENTRFTYKDVQKYLKGKDVAIEFVDFRDTTDVVYYALVLRKEYKYPKLVPLFNESKADSIYNSYALKSALYDPQNIESRQLYELIWEKLEAYIPKGSKVYYSPTGILHKINIDALPLNKSECIEDRYNMIRLSSTREICRNHNNKIDKVAIYGGIDYDLDSNTMAQESAMYQDIENIYAWNSRSMNIDSLSRGCAAYLPYTETEAQEIYTIMTRKIGQVTQKRAGAANEESFKSLSGGKTNILHLSTHGFFWNIDEASRTELFKSKMFGYEDAQNRYNLIQDPMQRSGLLFAGANLALKGMTDSIPHGVDDGILTAKEISNIDLRGTDIAVLSACDTGGGDVSGDGVFGLQRGFKQAGVQTIVMSLWHVNDQVTKELMVLFYTNWIVNKRSKREAFNKAVKSIRDKYPEPYYWAAFVMMD